MTHLEDLVRDTLFEHAAEAPEGPELLDAVRSRVVARRRTGRAVTVFAAAMVVVAVAAGVAVVTTHHRSHPPSTGPRPPAPQPTAVSAGTRASATTTSPDSQCLPTTRASIGGASLDLDARTQVYDAS